MSTRAVAPTTLSADPELLLVPASCTPCQRQLDAKRAWDRTLAVRTGSTVVGVRCDTARTSAALEEVLGPLRVPRHDHEVGATFSVEADDEGGSRRLFLVYRDHEVVARRRDRGSLVADLVRLLDELPAGLAGDLPTLFASALVTRAGTAVLVPGQVHRNLVTRRRDLDEAGARLLPGRAQRVDPATLELVDEAVDPGVASVLAGLSGAPVGARHPLRCVAVHVQGDSPVALRPVTGVFTGVGMVLNREAIGMGASLALLRALAGAVPMVGMPTLSTGAQAAAVTALLD